MFFDWILTVLSFVAVLGVLVFFHELGHYWVARRNGIVVEESSQHLTLRNQSSPSMVLSKSDIDSVKSSGVSLMPEGIESQIDEVSMVDLIGYIKNWRYVGGEAPRLYAPVAPMPK